MRKKFLNTIVSILLVVSVFGFVDATYLTVSHFEGHSITCNVIEGCDVVTSSMYSEVLGVPVALLGSLYYIFMIALCLLYFDRRRELVVRLASWFTIAGLVASLYFMSIMAFVLHAFCQYCLLSAITSTLLFVTGMTYLIKTKK